MAKINETPALSELEPTAQSDTLASRPDKSPEEATELSRDEKKRKFSQILIRGQLNERMDQLVRDYVPEGRRGAFVRERDADILRYQQMFYRVETNPDARGIHGTGDGRIRAGDCILMTISLEDYAIHKEVEHERLKEKLDAGRREYLTTATNQNPGVPVFDETTTH